MTDQTENQNPHKKRRRGPEPKPREEIRTNRISLRLTDNELASIQSRAGTTNPKQVAEFIRKVSLGKRLPSRIPEVNREAWSALARSAANLNQIAKALNSDEYVPTGTIQHELAQFRLALIGARPDAEGGEDES